VAPQHVVPDPRSLREFCEGRPGRALLPRLPDPHHRRAETARERQVAFLSGPDPRAVWSTARRTGEVEPLGLWSPEHLAAPPGTAVETLPAEDAGRRVHAQRVMRPAAKPLLNRVTPEVGPEHRARPSALAAVIVPPCPARPSAGRQSLPGTAGPTGAGRIARGERSRGGVRRGLPSTATAMPPASRVRATAAAGEWLGLAAPGGAVLARSVGFPGFRHQTPRRRAVGGVRTTASRA
jgi:hypothetical protein